jgi:hypothetical protein
MRRLHAKYLGEFDQVFDAEDMEILSAALKHGRPFKPAVCYTRRIRSNWYGRFSRSILLWPPRTASVTTAGYATALC